MTSERAIEEWLADERPRFLELLEELVITESHAAHPQGVAAVAQILARELAPLGFEFEASAPEPLPKSKQWLEELFSPGVPYSTLGSSYSAEISGERPGTLLLLGDLDTAFPVGTLAEFPFRMTDERAYGPGIADMKGGLVVLVAALQALRHLDLAIPRISMVLSGDEQAGSLHSGSLIERAATEADWCLCVECARRGGKLMAARGHIGVGALVVTGAEAHTGSARAKGINALEALARLVLDFNELSNPDAGVLVTVTIARAGKRRSLVPAYAEATVDIRTRSPVQWSDVIGRMERLAAGVEGDSGTHVQLLTYNHRPGLLWDSKTDDLLSLASAVGAELSIEVEAFRSAAAGSTAFRGQSTATLDGLGPLGSDLMTMREHIVVPSLVPRAALLAGIIHRLTPTPATEA